MFGRVISGILLGFAAAIVTLLILIVLSMLLPFVVIENPGYIATLVGVLVFILHLVTGYNPFGHRNL